MLNLAYKIGALQAIEEVSGGGARAPGELAQSIQNEDGEDADLPDEGAEQEDDSSAIRAFTAAVAKLPEDLVGKGSDKDVSDEDPKSPDTDASVSWSSPTSLRPGVTV